MRVAPGDFLLTVIVAARRLQGYVLPSSKFDPEHMLLTSNTSGPDREDISACVVSTFNVHLRIQQGSMTSLRAHALRAVRHAFRQSESNHHRGLWGNRAMRRNVHVGTSRIVHGPCRKKMQPTAVH